MYVLTHNGKEIGKFHSLAAAKQASTVRGWFKMSKVFWISGHYEIRKV